MYREYSHEITVNRPLSEAMPLFTPKGEESWVPGWAPDYISPKSGDTCEEMLFVTSNDDETTYWTCLNWQPNDGHVRYLRLTPESRACFVDVQCRPDGPESTRVVVTYQMHALNSAGRAYMSDMTECAFAEMIDGWAQLIQERVS